MRRPRAPDSQVERYRKRAADLRAMAEKATNRDARRELQMMARQYDKLAAMHQRADTTTDSDQGSGKEGDRCNRARRSGSKI